MLFKVIKILSREPSFRQLGATHADEFDEQYLISSFMGMSTGHKFVLHALINIIVHTEPRTLVLFDEPETHLHPPLLAVMMSAIRIILGSL